MNDNKITADQCRAARALLGLSQADLADISGVSRVPLANFEAGNSAPYPKTLDSLKTALEGAGVVFVESNGHGPGVRLRAK